MTKNTFIFNLEWVKILKDFEPEVRLEVYDAIFTYAEIGEVRELSPLAKMAFSFIKKEMDYNKARYDAAVEARSEAGKKGMAARWHNKNNNVIDVNNKNNNVISVITSDNKNNHNVNDNDNDNDNENENDNENDIEENKIKENIKEKKTKEELPSAENGADGLTPPPPVCVQKKKKKEKAPFIIPDDASEHYKIFINWLNEKTPHFFNGCEHIITQKEMEKLIARYDKDTLFNVLRAIENRKDKRGTYSNMYFTVNNWLKNEYARRENNKQQAW